MSGIVYYKNTTVPVPGVQFLIDGRFAQRTNGQIVETDAAGVFSISVPVGVHEVKSAKPNHVFANDGKITLSNGSDRDYQAPLAGLKLYDSTTIRFIGRVAGGAVQSDLPLGHSVSKNNLGDDIKIVVQLPETVRSAQSLLPETETGIDPQPGEKTVLHLLPANINNSSKISKTKVITSTNKIEIVPDAKTGEFVLDMIPVLFQATSVKANGWGELLDEGKPVTLDFTNKFDLQDIPAVTRTRCSLAKTFLKRQTTSTVLATTQSTSL